MKAAFVPPRLFVLFAREANVGVIFRRGPKRWVQLIHWNTANDVFTLGQWLHATVYPDRCDISPNGKLLLYFGAKHPHGNTWTAVSKIPYFTAIAYWGWAGTYGGGGLFHDNESVQLHGVSALSQVIQLREELVGQNVPSSVSIQSIWEEHLIRRGWQSIQRYNFERIGEAGEFGEYQYKTTPAILQRTIDFYSLKIEYAYDLHKTKYTLVDSLNGRERLLDVTWAGVDQRNRLVYTKDGKIYSGRLDDEFKLFRRELIDLNPTNAPDPQPAPEWAQKW